MEGIWRLEMYEMELGISAQVWYKGRILDALSGDVGGVCGLESKEVNGTKVEVMDIERERERAAGSTARLCLNILYLVLEGAALVT